MIKIYCPSNNIPERRYSIEVLFNHLMGCDVSEDSICFRDDVEDYIVKVGEKQMVIEDHFFSKYREPLSYLKGSSLPKELTFLHAKGQEIPIIYGVDKYVETEDDLTIGLDIFASTFFMLTRWEESIYGRDEKGDCNENLLFGVVHGICKRPVVNEYEFFLRGILSQWGVQMKQREYKVVLTHDVDGLITPTWSGIIRGLLFSMKTGSQQRLTWKQKVAYRRVFPNAYSQVDIYVKLCEQYNIPEWFFFKVCAPHETEATYSYDDMRVKDVVEKLNHLNTHQIRLGFHPSQSTINNYEQWESECHRIKELLGGEPLVGRNHHLLYNLQMLRWWEESFFTEGCFDISNCVFHRHQGFRSGMVVDYPIFDYYERRQMQLMEHPNSIMDTAIRYSVEKKGTEQIDSELREIISMVKRFKGELILTWHIYLRNKKLINDYIKYAEKIVRYATGC